MQLSITLIIIIVTCIVSFSAFNNERITNDLIFYPPAVRRGQWYRFFGCGLLHADVGHLIFNMLALYLFGHGSKIETEYGNFYTGVEFRFIDVFGSNGKYIYLGMYVLALGASLIPTYAKHKDNYHYRSLGASGAVSAVVFASILFNPLMGIGLFFIPVYIAGFLFGILYLVFSNWMEKRGGDNVNHSAHIFGALFGVGFTIITCQAFTNYPVLTAFMEQVKNVNPGELIQFGR
jgi:membrane associated rhomboid family serine protease